ncbi:hypothetical protein DH2020_045448 [Rehmannia glutinosa]|uniref:Myb/SANT-like domain-containing protein n=1 Tax=Rehmannia glutinosa TaxID=99300 RepID=A0ABR0UE47_REHGL
MPRTRNQLLGNMFNSFDWTEAEEEFLYDRLRRSVRAVHIADPIEWNNYLSVLATKLTSAFNRQFNVGKIKRRVELFRNQYKAFVKWKSFPAANTDFSDVPGYHPDNPIEVEFVGFESEDEEHNIEDNEEAVPENIGEYAGNEGNEGDAWNEEWELVGGEETEGSSTIDDD